MTMTNTNILLNTNAYNNSVERFQNTVDYYYFMSETIIEANHVKTLYETLSQLVPYKIINCMCNSKPLIYSNCEKKF